MLVCECACVCVCVCVCERECECVKMSRLAKTRVLSCGLLVEVLVKVGISSMCAQADVCMLM